MRSYINLAKEPAVVVATLVYMEDRQQQKRYIIMSGLCLGIKMDMTARSQVVDLV